VTLDWPHILFGAYVVVGPVVWLLAIGSLFLGLSRMNRLSRGRTELPADEPPPRVTVLVPAKDEGARIERGIGTVLAQDYPNFDVVAIDDRSTDGTGHILDQLAARDPRLRVVHVRDDELPDGWTGKCNALHRGVAEAGGEWLLFVDSDVTLDSHALSQTIAAALGRRYDAISLTTAIETHTFWERLLAPLAAGTWTVMNVVSLTNADNHRTALANGQFFLIRSAAHASVGGHAAVRAEPAEDVQLMRLMKHAGFRVRFFMGQHLASTRMHATLAQIVRGWARIYSTTSQRDPRRIVGALIFFVVCGLTAYDAILACVFATPRPSTRAWVIASLIHLALMTIYLAIMYGFSRNRRWYALLFPISAPVMLWVFVRGLWMCRTGRINWRGTSFTYVPTRPATK
jgi:cellulose synthase/poly-beta-1,6-N-acetylglucosamine synthase-like glycosyltransferase